MTLLTTTGICAMTAQLTGDKIKRAATKDAAMARFRKVAAEKCVDADLILDNADDFLAGKPVNRKAALALIEAETPAPDVAFKTKKAKAAKPRAEAAPKGPTKNQLMLDMVCRAGGATEQEICEAIGWKACLVTLRRVSAAAGVTLRAEKQKGGRARHFGTRA